MKKMMMIGIVLSLDLVIVLPSKLCAQTPAAQSSPVSSSDDARKHGDVAYDSKDYKEAMRWYLKAAEQGDAQAENSIGYMHDNGLSAKRDSVAAFNWYQKAADQGLASAQYNVATDYESGVGIIRDLAKARDWMQKAAVGGDEDAKKWLAEHGADEASPPRISELVASLKNRDLTPAGTEARDKAARELANIGAPAVASLIDTLSDQDAFIRRQAAEALGKIRDTRAVEPLTAALKDTYPDVRFAAIVSLGQIRDPGATSALIGALKDETAAVKAQAALALGEINDPRAIAPLAETLKSTDLQVRSEAAIGLSEINDPRAANILVANRLSAKRVTALEIADIQPEQSPDGKYWEIPDNYTIEANFGNLDQIRVSGPQHFILGAENVHADRCSGAVHTIKGNIRWHGWSFYSRNDNPLVFKMTHKKGYVYQRGEGLVVDPKGRAFQF